VHQILSLNTIIALLEDMLLALKRYISFTTNLNCVFILKLTWCHFASSLARLRFTCICSRPAQQTTRAGTSEQRLGAGGTVVGGAGWTVKELKAVETYK